MKPESCGGTLHLQCRYEKLQCWFYLKRKKSGLFWSQLETSPHVCLSVTRLRVIGVTMGTVGSNQPTDAIGPFRLVCIVR